MTQEPVFMAHSKPLSQAADQDKRVQEYELKASFLFNFAKYTIWPSHTFRDPKSPIILGIVGKDPFGEILDKAFANKKIGRRPILIKRFGRAKRVPFAHMIFFGKLAPKVESSLQKKLALRATLSIADRPGVAGKGTSAGFYMDRGKVRFEISKRAVEGSHLNMSSQLLKLAKLVDKQ